jgi:hypothetical protein
LEQIDAKGGGCIVVENPRLANELESGQSVYPITVEVTIWQSKDDVEGTAFDVDIDVSETGGFEIFCSCVEVFTEQARKYIAEAVSLFHLDLLAYFAKGGGRKEVAS